MRVCKIAAVSLRARCAYYCYALGDQKIDFCDRQSVLEDFRRIDSERRLGDFGGGLFGQHYRGAADLAVFAGGLVEL